ncbi:MAG: hypothetical protein P8N49_04170 [Opitutales bacterium]|nr:hypothetical protein [Opitutales bacterium]
MEIVNKKNIERYLDNDWILAELKNINAKGSKVYTSDQWLMEDKAKRFIYHRVYRDFSKVSKDFKLLDIGGGLSTFSHSFLSHLAYEIVDTCNHETNQNIGRAVNELEKMTLSRSDWNEFQHSGTYDCVVANDIFPNVDQRVEEFLAKFLPVTKEIRMSLTYYNIPRTYKVKRVDGDEIFYIRPWDGLRLSHALNAFIDRIKNPCLDRLLLNPESVFANGRQVCIVQMKGDL